MKLLLTSAGITNNSIKDALAGLIGKRFSDSKMVFIPTAANVEEGDKGWLIDDLKNFQAIDLLLNKLLLQFPYFGKFA